MLNIILSGYLLKPETLDFRTFWLGYIELQSRIPKKAEVRVVAAHSWNPELDDLVELVYAPILYHSQKQLKFLDPLVGIDFEFDFYERNFDRSKSTWKNQSIQRVFGFFESRSIAVSLLKLDSSIIDSDQILLTRWDLGQSGTSQVNRLVVDMSLPSKYVYLSYYSEVDEGYADMWIIGPKREIEKFSMLRSFGESCLLGQNDYIEEFTKRGWFSIRRKTLFESLTTTAHSMHIRSIISKKIGRLSQINSNKFHMKLIRRFARTIKNIIDFPVLSGETSYINQNQSDCNFPTFQALNVHAILKYFFREFNIRPLTRFLSANDIDNDLLLGSKINSQKFIIVTRLHKSIEGQSSHIMLREVMSAQEAEAIIAVDCNGHALILTNNAGQALIEDKCFYSNTITSLSFLLKKYKNLFFEASVLSWPNCKQLLSPKDPARINSLMKFCAWEKSEFVCLNQGRDGIVSLKYPDMYEIGFNSNIDIWSCAASFDSFLKFVSLYDNCPDLSKRAEKMNFTCLSYSPQTDWL